jgi:hypothetical protein
MRFDGGFSQICPPSTIWTVFLEETIDATPLQPNIFDDMTKIVTCRIVGQASWAGPEVIVVFETEEGFHFTCKTREIPWQVQNAIDSSEKVKAEVEAEPNDQECQLVKFIV